jgi:5-(carboxyamino)imidazole ribonucleotide mutase
MGSASDSEKMRPASETLSRFGIEADVRVLSAHRNPAQVVELVSSARDEGYVAFICGAGMAAHLAGVVAAHTTLPVVGVPLSGGALNGVDALYSTVQMPKGIPVATVAVDGAMNAALLVVEMLAISDEGLRKQLEDHRREIGGFSGSALSLPPVAAVVAFIDRINKGDVEGLGRLMTEGHVLRVHDEAPVVGRAANLSAWRGYVSAFPSYTIDPRGFALSGGRVVVWGVTTGSHLRLPDDEERQRGVLWVAEVHDGLVRSWSVLDDTDEHRRSLGVQPLIARIQ